MSLYVVHMHTHILIIVWSNHNFATVLVLFWHDYVSTHEMCTRTVKFYKPVHLSIVHMQTGNLMNTPSIYYFSVIFLLF